MFGGVTMALLWVEGFDKWGSGNAPAPSTIPGIKYKDFAMSSANIVSGRHGGYAIRLDTSTSRFVTPHLHSGGSDKTLICGLAFRSTSLRVDQIMMNFFHPTEDSEISESQFSLKLSANGPSSGLYICRGNTTLSTNNSAILSNNAWSYIEMKVYCDTVSGTCNVYVDGSEVISFTGNTRHCASYAEATTYSAVQLSSRPTYGIEHDYDDMYIADGSGNGVTDVLGPCQVECLSPTSDASGNWTPNTGPDLYDNVNSQEADSDFIYTSTSGNRAIFELDNLSANASSGNVIGVMLNAESEQLNDSITYAKALTQNGSGNSVQHTGNYMPGTDGTALSYSVIMEDDPDGNSWTANTINQFRAGVEAS
jgi:hypothetical protein